MKKLWIVNVLLIIGMLAALFLIYEHFVPSASKFCTFGENMDCGIVNKSPYANLDGISYLLTIDYALPIPLIDISGINKFFELLTSNAFLGFLTLVLVMLLLYTKHKKKDFWFIKNQYIMNWVVGILLFGVLYGLYLFYIQHSILKTYCPFCIALDLVLLSSLCIAWKMKKEESK